MSFFEAVGVCFSKYITFSGRARRSEYWFFFLFTVILNFVTQLLFQAPGIYVAIWVIMLLPSWAVTVRRLHDTGKSGWWLFMLIIAPIIACGFIIGGEVGGLFGGLFDGDIRSASAFWNSLYTIELVLILVLIFGAILMLVWLCQDSNAGSNEYGQNPKSSSNSADQQRYIFSSSANSYQGSARPQVLDENASQLSNSQTSNHQKTYEPVVGVETEALIKRAFLFLEDGETYNAERYIEQALNQDPENPQVYMAKLMLEHKVSTPEALIESLKTPLEDEKLYQRALRFADEEYRSQLENYAQADLAKKEEIYQEILKEKEEATTADELSALLDKIRLIHPYKDTDKIYEEVHTKSLIEEEQAEKRKRNMAIIRFIASIAFIIAGTLYSVYSLLPLLLPLLGFRRLPPGDLPPLLELQPGDLPPLSELQRQVEERSAEIQRQEEEAQRQAEAQRQRYESDYTGAVEYLNAKNYSPAVEIFRRLANEGYAPAQDKLAWMYQNGWGVEQSYSQAVSWFRKAAEQGNTEALASMGLMYLKGWGVPQNYDTALEWYGKAAAQGSEVAQRRINSIQLLKVNKQKISSIERGTGFPVPGTIFAETLSVRQSPETNSRRVKTLKTGHPVSISRAVESDNDYWFYIKTASGTEGWVLGGYVKLIDRDLSYQENSNRRYSLPKSGYVRTSSQSSFLNLRNIPAVRGSDVVEKLDNGESFTAYEVFAGDTIDWYRIRTSFTGNEGWVSGKYIELNY